jgi:hypothetical protein
MTIDGFPVCEDEQCFEFIAGPVEVTFEGKTYHYDCLHPQCNDCLVEFTEFEPRIKEDRWYFHEEGKCPAPQVNNLPVPPRVCAKCKRLSEKYFRKLLCPLNEEVDAEMIVVLCPTCEPLVIWENDIE